MTVHHNTPPQLVVRYQRVRQPVVVRASPLSNVPPVRLGTPVNEARKRANAKVTGTPDPTTPVLINAILPDIDTEVDGKKTKIVFKYVDANTVEIMAINLEQAKKGKDGTLKPVVHNLKLDFKKMNVSVNGVKRFDLAGTTTDKHGFTGVSPVVYSQVDNEKPKKGIRFAPITKSFNYLFELVSVVLLYVATTFVIEALIGFSSVIIVRTLGKSVFTGMLSSTTAFAVRNGMKTADAVKYASGHVATLATAMGSNLQSVLTKGIEYSAIVPIKSLIANSGAYAVVFS